MFEVRKVWLNELIVYEIVDYKYFLSGLYH